MEETSLAREVATVSELPVGGAGSPAPASRRDVAGRVALLMADVLALGASMVSCRSDVGAAHPVDRRTRAGLRVVGEVGGLYDRDQYVLHKTTLEEGPSLLGVSAIFALLIEATQALKFHGRSSRCSCC